MLDAMLCNSNNKWKNTLKENCHFLADWGTQRQAWCNNVGQSQRNN